MCPKLTLNQEECIFLLSTLAYDNWKLQDFSNLIYKRTLEHILQSKNICSSSSNTYEYMYIYKYYPTIPEDGYVVVQNGVLVAWRFQSQLDTLLLL